MHRRFSLAVAALPLLPLFAGLPLPGCGSGSGNGSTDAGGAGAAGGSAGSGGSGAEAGAGGAGGAGAAGAGGSAGAGGGGGSGGDVGTDAGDDSGDGGGTPVTHAGPGGDFRAYAKSGASALHTWFNGSGLFDTTGWWNSANGVTALVDYQRATKTQGYVSDLDTTYSKHSGSNFLNKFYDDEGWWSLAWIRAYDLTGDAKYLSMAKVIFADMTGGWDNTCGGGIWWNKDKKYKNAIANELFFLIAARLHTRTPNDLGANSFGDWAAREWKWFDASGMINGSSLVNDGLAINGSSCTNNNQQTWTYNQGVLIGALVEWSVGAADPTLVTRAEALADATLKKLVDDQGVLHEPCEEGGTCGGDAPQFKGIFMRHLGELTTVDPKESYRAFIAKNADWIWNADKTGDKFGLSWSQLPDSTDAARQTSGLDALVAAIPFTDPQTNLALKKSVKADADCGAGQGAANAVDGSMTTKWCSGGQNGGYFLDIDLGSMTDVGRVIVRHAAAGGEKAAWNTLAFSISLSPDDAAFNKVADVTGNKRGVTIHSFTPVQARYLKLDISTPQSDPTVVAARVYEVEAYAR